MSLSFFENLERTFWLLHDLSDLSSRILLLFRGIRYIILYIPIALYTYRYIRFYLFIYFFLFFYDSTANHNVSCQTAGARPRGGVWRDLMGTCSSSDRALLPIVFFLKMSIYIIYYTLLYSSTSNNNNDNTNIITYITRLTR